MWYHILLICGPLHQSIMSEGWFEFIAVVFRGWLGEENSCGGVGGSANSWNGLPLAEKSH